MGAIGLAGARGARGRSTALTMTMLEWEGPRERRLWYPTFAQRTRKDGAPSGLLVLGEHEVLRLRSR